MTVLTACQPGSRLPSSELSGLRVTAVSAAIHDPNSADASRFPDACDHWTLTPEQVETFFTLSTELDARAYHHEYEVSPCMIEGELVDSSRAWTFQINGAAKGFWSNGSQTRYFGCPDAECEPLVLVPHIGMNP